MIQSCCGRVLAIVLCVTTVAAPWPRAARAASPAAAPAHAAPLDSGAPATRDTVPIPTQPHFLRDAVPSAGFASAPEDTTDEGFLPEEHNTRKLVWDIAAWVVGAALVAFFIIKVFIEKDPDQPSGGGGTKPDPF